MIPALMAFATVPVAVQGWSLGPSYLFSSPLLLDDPAEVFHRQRELANRMLDQTDSMIQQSGPFPSSPRYELVDNEDKFEVSLDVPGVKPDDMTISLEREGYITIRGERAAKTDNSRFASKFSQTFSLDPSVDLDSVKANLDSGVLVVSASKDKSRLEDKTRKVPIKTGAAVTNALKEAPAEEAPNSQNGAEFSAQHGSEEKVDIIDG